MSLPKEFLDDLRLRVPLSDVVGKRVRLTRAGREYKACCPFHNEKTPSFTLNDEKGFYHCFGCGAHGDVIRFVMEHDNLPFIEAIEQLAALAGMTVPKSSPDEIEKYRKKNNLYDLLEVACTYFQQKIFSPDGRVAIDYFRTRGLTKADIEQFRLGYSPESGEALCGFLLKQGFSADMIIEAGLAKPSQHGKGSEIFSFFRGRAMFPVTDLQGRVVAFGARVLPGAPKEAPKYINSPESPVFHKGRMLYGLSRARQAIGDGAPVAVVEGYMDVIAMNRAGFSAAVAPLGTALTEMQVLELWKVMPAEKRAPVLCFDGDSAGQRAAARALDRILPVLKPDHTVRFAFLPDGQDPDDLISREGPAAMKRILENAVSLMDMLWMEEVRDRDFRSPEIRAGLKSALDRRIAHIADKTVQTFYFHEVNQRIKSEFLSQPQLEMAARSPKYPYRGKPKEPGAHTPYRPLGLKVRPIRAARHLREKLLLAAMINYPVLFEEFGEALGMLDLGDAELDAVRQELVAVLSEGNSLDFQAVKQHLSQAGLAGALDALFDKSLYVHGGFAKPGQDLETVRQGWRDAWERGFSTSRPA